MTKAKLRSEFLAHRRALPPDEVARQSLAFANQFFALPSIIERLNPIVGQNTPVFIHTFLPIDRYNEVNTWPIIHRLWHRHPGVQVVASITDTATNQLTHYAFTDATALVSNRWGIPEPVPTGEPIQPSLFEVVLVPLLAFDKQGHRVGYGKGFYDRFLAQCRPDCLKVGLSLFQPVERIMNVEATDIRLDLCLTPTNSFDFQ